MRARRWNLGSAQTWFAVAAIATFVYGVESWRRRASARASTGEQARLHAAVTCLLGADGVPLAYRPGEARARLRALAMDTSLTPSPTWIDRCVPLLRDLAVHGAEVDVTQDLRSAPTAVARHARELALATARVGLVWEVRAGGPDSDMDHIAELLVRTTTEIDLASVTPTTDAMKGPRAPVPRPMPPMLTLATGGLLPLPVGTPERFLVGAPLPLLSTVSVRAGALAITPGPNDDARWWRVVPQGLVRVVAEEGAHDGLAPVYLDAVDGPVGSARIAAPPPTLDPRAVALDAVARDNVLWLAEAVRGQSPVLARLPFEHTHGVATAARLSPPPTPEMERVDEEVAVTADARGVLAAFTRHLPSSGAVDVRLVRASGGERAAVHDVTFAGDAWQLSGRKVGLSFCTSRVGTWLFAASGDAWRAGLVRDGTVIDAGTVIRSGTRRFDDATTVRCGPQGVVVYGRERPRGSPLWRCAVGESGVPRCGVLPALPSEQPRDLPPWTTFTPRGERRAHAEWPFALALTTRGTVLAARASGTVVAVARLPAGATAWETERVVFDASGDAPGATVLGAELYTDGVRTLVAVSRAQDLRVSRSDDEGATWHLP